VRKLVKQNRARAVASYSAVINLNVVGTDRLTKVTAAIGQLNRLTQDLNKSFNLLAPGAGKLGDKLRIAFEPIKNFAREATNGTAKFSNTLQGAAQQAEVFQTVLRNVAIKKGGFSAQTADVKNFANALAQASAQTEELERRLNQLMQDARQQQGLAIGPTTELDSLEADLARRQYYEEQKITQEKQKQAILDARAVRIQEELNNRLKQRKQLEERRQRLQEDLLLGAGFPLLFGGGAGSIVGGAAGALAAGGGPGGFGLQIGLSALGTVFDKSAASAKEFAASLREDGDAVGYLEQAVGRLDPRLKRLISGLQQSGQTARAAALAKAQLVSVLGTEGVDALERNGKATDKLIKKLKELGLQIYSVYAQFTAGLSDLLYGPGQRGGVQPDITDQARDAEELSKKQTQLAQAQALLAGINSTKEFERYQNQQKYIASLEKEIQQKKNLRALDEGITLEERKRRDAQADAAYQAELNQLSLAAEERRLQIQSNRLQVGAAITEEHKQLLELTIRASELEKGQLNGMYDRYNLIDARTRLEFNSLEIERSAALIDAQRNGTVTETVKLFDLRLKNLKEEAELEKLSLARRYEALKLEKALRKEQRVFAFEEQIRGVQKPEFKTPLEQLTITQAERRQDILGPRFQELDVLTQQLAKPEAFDPEQLTDFKDRVAELNQEITVLTNKLNEVDAAEITWEKNTAGVQAMTDALNATGRAVTDVLGELITGTLDWNSALRQTLISLSKVFLNAGLQSLAGTDGIGFFSFLTGGLKGKATGGSVAGGTPYMVGERGPELFVPGRSGTIVPNNQLGAGGATSVTVNVDASGSSVEGNEQGANQLGKAIGLAVQQELIKQKRPGGLLAGV
jgi:hypothetical protein